MFYVLQNIHIKRNPNGIKMDGELFWNIWDFPEEESTRNGVRGGHEAGGRALHPRGALVAPPTYFFLLYISMYPSNI